MSKKRSKPSYTPKPGVPYKKISEKEENELRAYWYEKLAKTKFEEEDENGNKVMKPFEDIEWFDVKTGKGQMSYLSTDIIQRGKNYKPETDEFYTMLREFVTMHQFIDPKLKFIAEMYSEGISFRNMIKMLKKSRWKLTRSIFWIYSRVEHIKDLVNMYFDEKVWDIEDTNYELGPGFIDYRSKYKSAKICK